MEILTFCYSDSSGSGEISLNIGDVLCVRLINTKILLNRSLVKIYFKNETIEPIVITFMSEGLAKHLKDSITKALMEYQK